VLLRLAYLAVTNGLAMLRLLPTSDRDKDAEILALRHQITVLERQLHNHGHRVRFAPADRALLAALLHRLARLTLHQIRLVVRPDTILRWHRDLVAAHHARISRPRRVGPSTVWEIRKDADIDPAPQRNGQTWATFLRTQAEAILASDFLETVTLTGKRMCVLAVIEHATRRVRILGATAHPTAAWVTQTARNLAMDLHDAGNRSRFLIRDRDGKCPALFDTILADARITVVLSGVRMPCMNAIMERWVRTCRRELLDRTLIWNQAHLHHALRQYERHYNEHRPHRGASRAPDRCNRYPSRASRPDCRCPPSPTPAR
jgi:putative transposase